MRASQFYAMAARHNAEQIAEAASLLQDNSLRQMLMAFSQSQRFFAEAVEHLATWGDGEVPTDRVAALRAAINA